MRLALLWFAAFFCLSVAPAIAAPAPVDSLPATEEEPKRTAENIQDNSFFIEEAYNQEAGVVQHILNVIHTVNRHAVRTSANGPSCSRRSGRLFRKATNSPTPCLTAL